MKINAAITFKLNLLCQQFKSFPDSKRKDIEMLRTAVERLLDEALRTAGLAVELEQEEHGELTPEEIAICFSRHFKEFGESLV
jgi:hypothetical protein